MNNYKRIPPKSINDQYSIMYPNSNKNLKQLTFQVTEDCCLRCTYCYQTNKSRNKMTFDTVKKCIDSLLNDEYEYANRSNTDGIVCEFIGGEPLMEIELIDKSVEYILTRLIELNHPWMKHIRFSICSNGVLFETKAVQEFFKKYNTYCEFAISIDGNKELHDSCRVDMNGNGSYDIAIRSAKHYRKLYNKMPGLKMTLSPDNISYTKDAVLNLISEGYEIIYLNCTFEKGWEIEHARILYNQLKVLAEYIIDNDLYDKIFISMYDEDKFHPLDDSSNTNWCGGVKDKMLAVDYKGDLYPCIRYMDSSLNGKQPPIILGSTERGYLQSESDKVNIEKITNITRRSQSTDECYYCPIASGCAWCSAYNYQETGSVNKRVTYICIMHKATALANIYYWNMLYQHIGIEKKFINYVNDTDIDNIILPMGDDDNGKQFIKQFKAN